MNSKDYKIYLRALEGRTNFSIEQRKEMYVDQLGDEGEKYFKSVLDTIENIQYISNFEISVSNHVQIDFLVAASEKIFIFEIKHYSNEWFFEDDYIKSSNGQKYHSPMIQVAKIKKEVQNILNKTGISREIQAFIIFTNPHFNLVGERPPNIILLHEIPQLFKIIDTHHELDNEVILTILKQFESIHSTYYHKNIALVKDKVASGLRCPKCRKMYTISFSKFQRKYFCYYCKEHLNSENIIYSNLQELFIIKRKPFKLKEAIEWCQPVQAHTVRRVCQKHFKSQNVRNKRFYIE